MKIRFGRKPKFKFSGTLSTTLSSATGTEEGSNAGKSFSAEAENLSLDDLDDAIKRFNGNTEFNRLMKLVDAHKA